MADPARYTIGWICALHVEFVAAQALLDEEYDGVLASAHHDNNSYALGRIGGHNVVIAVLPDGEYGNSSAAVVARDMLHSFPSVRIGLMVGIAGGAPSSRCDIRLGDVVVSSPGGGKGGVIQYDMGKALQGQHVSFQHTGFLDQPPSILRTAVSALKSKHKMKGHQINAHIEAALEKWPRLREEYSRPAPDSDKLYRSDFIHKDSSEPCDVACASGSTQGNLIHRKKRTEHQDDPIIHYGLIASANQLVKDARIRDKLASEKDVLCFEMEAAGLMNHFPCLVIRGICDYADSHKNKDWQGFAAISAAAFTKDLLSVITPFRLSQETPIPQLVADPRLHELVSNVAKAISHQTHTQGTVYESDKHKECHQAFKTSSYESFKNINANRVVGTCRWVTEHPRYNAWRRSSHDDLLWISADPGCGKSVLSKALIDEELPTDGTVCYFFFKDNEEQDSLATALCALLHQLFSSKPRLLRHAAEAFRHNSTKLQGEVDQLWRILIAATKDDSAGPVTCILDALDECRGRGRKKLISLLTSFYASRIMASTTTNTSHLKFLVTSRPYQDIELGFGGIPNDLPSIRLAGEESNADINEEINLVIRQKLKDAGERLHPDQEVRDSIQTKLLSVTNRTYLWLHLVWDELQYSSKRTKKAYLKKIDSLPFTVEEAYEKILSKCGRDSEARSLLHIVVAARRPLSLKEMDVALQLATDAPNALQHEDLDLDGGNLKSRIRELCGLFVFINDDKVYLIHQTAKEFLVAREGVPSRTWRFSLQRQHSNKIMTYICVQYLLFQDISTSHLSGRSLVKGFPFLEYSAVNWPAHFDDMKEMDDEQLLGKISQLYDDPNHAARFDAWAQLFWVATQSQQDVRGATPLHLAALNGHDWVVAKLLEANSAGLETQDYDGATPLGRAARSGRIETVKFLLSRGADPNAYGGNEVVGGNALYIACEKGNLEIAKLLLDNGAKPNASCYYFTALQAASNREHYEIMKLLLLKGADPNPRQDPDCYHYPLRAAAAKGRVDIAQLLLEKGAKTDATSDSTEESYAVHGNALYAASQYGHLTTVKLLLDNGADPNARMDLYYKPLKIATREGHTGIVEQLLAQGADPNLPDYYGDLPLFGAALQGRYEITQLLLDYGADPRMRTAEEKYTAADLALLSGCTEVEQLLQRSLEHLPTRKRSASGPLESMPSKK